MVDTGPLFLDSRGRAYRQIKVVSKAQIATVLSKILRDLYQEGNWLDVISCKRKKENPVIDSMLPMGLLTSSDIQAITEGVIDIVKFFQLGLIIWTPNYWVNSDTLLLFFFYVLTSGFETADPHRTPPMKDKITALYAIEVKAISGMYTPEDNM